MENEDHKKAEAFARSLLDESSTGGAMRNLCLCYLDAAVEPVDQHPHASRPAGPRVVIQDVQVSGVDRDGKVVWNQCPICSSTVDVYDDEKLRCLDDDCNWIGEAVEGKTWTDSSDTRRVG